MTKHKQTITGFVVFKKAILKIGYCIALLVATLTAVLALTYVVGDAGFYSFVGLAYLLLYALLTPAFVMLLFGKSLNKALRLVCFVWVLMAILALLLLVYGIVKDSMGVYCAGFFGVRSSCLSNQFLLALVLFFYPYSVAMWLGLSLIALIGGWAAYLTDRRSASVRSK
jgi:hypothetical protein